jgi:hypothetical protein
MKKVYKDWLKVFALFVVVLFLALWYSFSLGFDSLEARFYFILAYIAVFFVPLFLVATIAMFVKRPPVKEAEDRELEKEDDILLQATAFSQSALWIYLNILPPNTYIDIMKWVVPSTAIIFYAVRAYAKMKASKIWRYRSIFALTFVVSASLFSLFMTVVETNFKNLIIIDGKGVTTTLLIPLFALVYVVSTDVAHSYFRKRYGLEKSKTK